MRAAVVIAILVTVMVLMLLFVPTRLLGMQIPTEFAGDKLTCGSQFIEVWTTANGTALKIRTSGSDYELNYYGSTLARDSYRSQTGEEANYDAELSLSGFANGAVGTCY